jgi:Zn-dependent protease with chaperone function
MARPPRLNPFAFPSDTTSRFFLLIVFVISGDVLYWNGAGLQLGDTIGAAERCFDVHPVFDAGAWLDEGKALPIERCAQAMTARVFPYLALGLSLLAVGTFGVFWFYPLWLRWRLRLEVLPRPGVPDLDEALTAVCAAAGLNEQPAFLWNPLDGSARALAFGRGGGRCCVALTGGVAGLFYVNSNAFRALMLHELAHIRNGDIVKTYLTVALWWTFVVTALAPYLLIELFNDHSWSNVLDALFRLTVFGGIVFLSRNAVLRARELYADVRASTWEGSDGELRAALATLRPERGLPRWLLVHPDPRLRRRLLDNTDPLFQASAWNAFGIGAAAAIAVVALLELLANAEGALVPMTDTGFSPSTVFTVALVPFLVIVPLTTMAAVVVVWRGAFLAAIRGYNPRLMFRTALPLAAGVVFGIPIFFGYPFLMALSGGEGARYVASGSLPLATLLLGGAALVIVAVLGLSTAFMLYLSWVQLVARAWLPVALRQRTPRAVWAAGFVAAGALSLPWFSYLPVALAGIFAFSVESLKQRPTNLAELAAYIVANTRSFPFNMLAWVSLVAVWAYPMAASLRWPGRDSAGCWVWLDPGPPVSLAQPLRVGRSLLVGIAGGVVGGIVLCFTILDLPPGVIYQFYLPRAPSGIHLASAIVLAIAAQVLTSVAAAVAAKSLAFVHAMFAAFTAGLVLVAAQCLHVLVLLPDANLHVLLHAVFAPTVVGGAYAALPVAAVMAALLDRDRPKGRVRVAELPTYGTTAMVILQESVTARHAVGE